MTFPPNRGFAGAPKSTLVEVGIVLDRYGDSAGEFLYTKNPLFLFRSHPLYAEGLARKSYEVIEPFTAFVGRTASWYGKVGGSLQFDLGIGTTVQDLIDQKVLMEIAPS